MYCRKCGKEVEENSKFCPFCGYGLEGGQDRVSDTMKQNAQSQKADKNVNSKKWMIPVGIIAGIVVIGIVVFLGVKVVRKPEEVSKPEVVEEQEEPVEKEQKVEYPQEITMSESERKGITDLLDIVSHIEGAGDYKEIENVFADIFLRTSVERGIPFVDGQAADWDAIPKDSLDDYLKNSIGYQNYDVGNGGEVNDGVIYLYGACGEIIPSNNAPQINKTTQISDDEIEITGTVDYTESDYIGFLPYTIEFDVIMAKNQDSMWGGYTLKEIKSWENKVSEDKNANEVNEELLSRLLYVLGNVDYRGNFGKLMTLNQAELADDFLYYSLYYAEDVMRGKVTPAEDNWVISRSEITEYLQNSLGSSECGGAFVISENGDYITIGKGNPPYVLMVEDVVVTSVEHISDTEIKVSGEMIYRQDEMGTEKPVKCQLTMEKNSESVWSGYMIKSIDSWSEEVYSHIETPEEVLNA